MTVGELKIKLSAETSEFENSMDYAKTALENMEKKNQAAIGDFSGLSRGIKEAGEEMIKAVPGIMDEAEKEFLSYNPMIMKLGESFAKNLSDGILNSSGYLDAAIADLGRSAMQQVESLLAEVSGKLNTGVGESISAAQNTYNNYYTTYNAQSTGSEGVNLADFENRIRRAYA